MADEVKTPPKVILDVTEINAGDRLILFTEACERSLVAGELAEAERILTDVKLMLEELVDQHDQVQEHYEMPLCVEIERDDDSCLKLYVLFKDNEKKDARCTIDITIRTRAKYNKNDEKPYEVRFDSKNIQFSTFPEVENYIWNEVLLNPESELLKTFAQCLPMDFLGGLDDEEDEVDVLTDASQDEVPTTGPQEPITVGDAETPSDAPSSHSDNWGDYPE